MDSRPRLVCGDLPTPQEALRYEMHGSWWAYQFPLTKVNLFFVTMLVKIKKRRVANRYKRIHALIDAERKTRLRYPERFEG